MDMFIAIITFGYMESITCFQITDNILNTLMLTITYICFLLYLEKCQKWKQITDIYKMNTCLFHSNFRFSKILLHHGGHVQWWIKSLHSFGGWLTKFKRTYYIFYKSNLNVKNVKFGFHIKNKLFFLLISKCLASET
jgi:ABC-type uncharacterized transport system permease subunit